MRKSQHRPCKLFIKFLICDNSSNIKNEFEKNKVLYYNCKYKNVIFYIKIEIYLRNMKDFGEIKYVE